jgi:lysophospholipase L1-like esterase
MEMNGNPIDPVAKRIVCLGDSLTLAIGSAELDKWPVRVALELEKEFPGRYALFIRAWNGATTFDALQRMAAEIGYLMPATVLVALGVNDAHVPPHRQSPLVGVEEFSSNLREIHRQVCEGGGKTIFVVEHTPIPSPVYIPGNGKSYAENVEPYRQAVLQIAGIFGAPVIDISSLMEDRGIETSEIVTEDGLHLSRDGNAVYAGLIFAQLQSLKNI